MTPSIARLRSLALAALLALAASPAAAQSVQYRSPAGVEYRAQRDTGPIARAERALAAEPRSVQRFIQLGVAQAGARQMREAVETFTRALAVAPDDPMLHRWRGHRHLSIRELDRAMADLTRGFTLDSTNYGTLYHLGVLRFVRGDTARARAQFERSVASGGWPAFGFIASEAELARLGRAAARPRASRRTPRR